MKDKCDNVCSTCTMNTQVGCSLAFAKSNNDNMAVLSKKMDAVNEAMVTLVKTMVGDGNTITPIGWGAENDRPNNLKDKQNV